MANQSDLDDEFLDSNITEFRRLFVAGELARRRLPDDYPVLAAVVELRPGAAPKVTLNEDAQIQLVASAGAQIQPGDGQFQ